MSDAPADLSDDLDGARDADVPRVHSQDPAEGADPADADQSGADVPRVHAEDAAEGQDDGTDTTNPQ